MKILECSRCHRIFKSTDEHIFIHTKTNDFNWCDECTERALQLMGAKLDEEKEMQLNRECMRCPIKQGCLTLCATKPEDVIHPPCGYSVVGANYDEALENWNDYQNGGMNHE